MVSLLSKSITKSWLKNLEVAISSIIRWRTVLGFNRPIYTVLFEQRGQIITLRYFFGTSIQELLATFQTIAFIPGSQSTFNWISVSTSPERTARSVALFTHNNGEKSDSKYIIQRFTIFQLFYNFCDVYLLYSSRPNLFHNGWIEVVCFSTSASVSE